MLKYLASALVFFFSISTPVLAQDACKALSDDLAVQEKALAATYADAIAMKGEAGVLLQLRVNGVLTIIQTLVTQMVYFKCDVPARAITAVPYLEPAVECSIELAKQRKEMAARRLPPSQLKEPDVCDRKTWIAK
ncbi:MAG: hypothetical protein IT563_03830 [Alphaproteobacteria bacterium]|nr:hypothetical protein [Alphaproteobacteria bacterium]